MSVRDDNKCERGSLSALQKKSLKCFIASIKVNLFFTTATVSHFDLGQSYCFMYCKCVKLEVQRNNEALQ